MLNDLKSILIRSRATALEDTLGVVSLFVFLFAALSMSGGV